MKNFNNNIVHRVPPLDFMKRESPLSLEEGRFNYGSWAGVAQHCSFSKGTHTVCGPIPKIVITPPPPTRRVIRPRAPRVEPKYISAFYAEIASGWRKEPTSIRAFEKAIRAFKKMWIFEHNVSKKVVVEKYDNTPLTTTPLGWSEAKLPRPAKAVIPDTAPVWPIGMTIPSRMPLVRNGVLLAKLREIIATLRQKRAKRGCKSLARINRAYISKLYRRAAFAERMRRTRAPRLVQDFEMDDGKGENQVICHPASDVTLQSHTNPKSESTVRLKPLRKRIVKVAGGDNLKTFESLTDRWLQYGSYEWFVGQQQDTELAFHPLPFEAFKNNPDCANFTPLRIHQYCRFDNMIIRVQVNATKFQIGSLQVAWFPNADEMKFMDYRRNVHCGSQAPNVVVDAAISSDAELTIPFKTYRTFIPLKVRHDMDNVANVGHLRMSVLNPLRASTGTSVRCQVNVYIRFENLQFMGQTDAKIGALEIVENGEMMPMLGMMAAQQLLHQIDPDRNRDRPPYQQCLTQMVPTYTQSLCLGDNLAEPLSSMRLDARGQTPHPEGSDSSFTMQNVGSQFGLVTTFEWKATHIRGTELKSFEAAPVWDKSIYRKVVVDGVECSVLPPCAVMNSLVGAWSGEIILKFEFISSSFHSGRLMFVFIPHILTGVTFKQALSSPNVTFDLGSNREFTFTIPYMSDRPYWPHRLSTGVDSEVVDPPGKVYVFVNNTLQYSNNIPDTVYINVYQAASKNFQYGYPVQPSLGLSFDVGTPTPVETHRLYARPGYAPYYVSWWSWAKFGGQSRAVLFWGTATNEVAQFQQDDGRGPGWGNYYTYKNQRDAERIAFERLTPGGGTELITPTIFVPLNVNDGYGHVYLTAYASIADVQKDFFYKKENVWTLRSSGSVNYSNAIIYYAASEWSDGNPVMVASTIPRPLNEDEDIEMVDRIEVVELQNAEIDQREDIVEPPCLELPSPRLADEGRLLWGERFGDLKSLCRRYQYYCHATRVVPSAYLETATAICNFPVLPQGLDLMGETNVMVSQIRDGIIPICLSGFRYYRGSVNFKIFLECEVACKIIIQHRPERACTKSVVSAGGRTTMDARYNHGYATVVQDSKINTSVTVNVPFYQIGSLGLLQRPAFSSITNATRNFHFSLGELSIFVVPYGAYQRPKAVNVHVDVFYSLGDDFSPSEFIGFPPMILIKDYEKREVMTTPALVQDCEMDDPTPTPVDSPKSMTTELFGLACAVGSTISNIKWAERLTQYFAKPVISDMQVALSDFEKSFNISLDFDRVLLLLGSNVMHCVLTPSTGHFVIMLISLLLELGLIASDLLARCVKILSSLFDKYGAGAQHPQGPGDDSVATEFSAMLFAGIAATLGIATIPPQGVVSTARNIIRVIQDIGRSHNGITSLFDSFIKIVIRAVRYFEKTFFSDRLTTYYLSQTPEVVRRYYQEAIELLDPSFEEQILTSTDAYARLDTCVYVGSLLLRDLSLGDRKMKVVSALLTQQSKLMMLRDRAHKANVAINKRREPFCIHLTGPHGIGKSQIGDALIEDLLRYAGIDCKGPTTYIHSASSKHWDGYVNQKVIVFDDLHILNDPSAEIDEFGSLFKLKSCAPFRPPMASLEDKGRFCAPELIVIFSNNAYPVSNSLSNSMALYRRYDMVVEVTLTPEVISRVSNISHMDNLDAVKRAGIDLETYQHLHFFIKSKPYEPNSERSPSMSYHQMRLEARRAFVRFREHQFSLQRNRTSIKIPSYQNPESALKEFLASNTADGYMYSAYRACVSKYQQLFGSVEDDIESFELDEDDEPVAEYTNDDLVRDLLASAPPVYDDPVGYVDGIYVAPGEDLTQKMLERANPTRVSINMKTANRVYEGIAVLLGVRTRRLAQERGNASSSAPRGSKDCPHTFSRLSGAYVDDEALYDFNDMTIADCHEDSSLEPCNLRDPNYVAYLKRRLLKETSQWHLILKLYPNILRGDETSYTPTISLAKMDSLLDELQGTLNSEGTYSKMKRLRRILQMVILPLSAFVFGMYSASKFNWFGKKNEKTRDEKFVCDMYRGQVQEIVPSGDTRTRSTRTPGSRGIRLNRPAKVVIGHQDTEMASCDMLTPIVRRNTFFITISGEHKLTSENTRVSARCLGISDRYCMIPRHYIVFYLSLKKSTRKCEYFRDDGAISIPLDQLDRWDIEQDEVSVLLLPAQVPPFRDIRSHFLSCAQLDRPLPRQAWFTEMTSDYGMQRILVDIEPQEHVSVVVEGMTVEISQCIGYSYHGKGKCGSVIVSSIGNGKIIGMHISGREGRGSASYLYSEMFECIPSAKLKTDDFDAGVMHWNQQSQGLIPSHEFNMNVIDLGIVDNRLRHRESGETKIKASVIHGIFPITTAPAPLTFRDERCDGEDPYQLGVEKHGSGIPFIDREVMEIAVEDYRSSVFSSVKPLTDVIQPLSLNDAINGNRSMKLKSIEMRTSEGFPWSSNRPVTATNKRWLFDYNAEGVVTGVHPELSNALCRGVQRREESYVQPTVFIDCLKDARLPLEKCVAGKTRIFSISPIDYTILFRKYFSSFFCALQESRLEHQVGMAVQKSEWTMLGSSMDKFSNYHLCGDYSAFGDTLEPNLVKAVFDIAIEWLTHYERRHLSDEEIERNNNVRRCLAQETINCVHLAGNVLYQCYCGMASGNPVTVNINSSVGSLYIRCVWQYIFKHNAYLNTMDQLHKHVMIKTYGDDLWLSVSGAVINHFNNRALQKAYASMGIKYTDASKTSEVVKYSLFKDVTFLKHRFLAHPSRKDKFLAALDKSSVTDCANWVRDVKDSDVISSLETSYATLMLAYGWGPIFFNYIRKTLANAWLERRVKFEPRTWKQLDDLYYQCDELECVLDEYVDYSNPIDFLRALDKYQALLRVQEDVVE